MDEREHRANVDAEINPVVPGKTPIPGFTEKVDHGTLTLDYTIIKDPTVHEMYPEKEDSLYTLRVKMPIFDPAIDPNSMLGQKKLGYESRISGFILDRMGWTLAQWRTSTLMTAAYKLTESYYKHLEGSTRLDERKA